MRLSLVPQDRRFHELFARQGALFIGAGAPRRLTAAGWGVGATMLTAWALTIPSSAVIGWLAYAMLHTARIG